MEALFNTAERNALTTHSRNRPPELYIFGAGGTGVDFLQRLRRAGNDAKGFLDNNPTLAGTMVEGVPVCRPDEIGSRERAVLVVPALCQAAQVTEQCRTLGFTKILQLNEFFRMYGDQGEMDRLEALPEVAAAANLWSDDASRKVYRDLLRYRISFAHADVPVTSPDQYLNADVVAKEWLRSFVDCGAYIGDTLQIFRRMAPDFDNYYAFEPDPVNLGVLKKEAGDDRRVRIFNMLLGDRPGEMGFITEAGGMSRISEQGGTRVKIDRLDNVLADQPATFIKMDVESYEPVVLNGAVDVIRRQRPVLAICVYHRLEHLWSIPLWIAGLGLGYRFMLRHHGGDNHTETVCYALPD